jgi:hypothetical protein
LPAGDAYWRLAKRVIKDTMSASRLWLALRMVEQIVENEGQSRITDWGWRLILTIGLGPTPGRR